MANAGAATEPPSSDCFFSSDAGAASAAPGRLAKGSVPAANNPGIKAMVKGVLCNKVLKCTKTAERWTERRRKKKWGERGKEGGRKRPRVCASKYAYQC